MARFSSARLAGGRGFEPRLMDPESIVLPLDDPPVTPKNRTGIGQKIQSFLSRSKMELETRLRIQCSNAWGFESPLPHHS